MILFTQNSRKCKLIYSDTNRLMVTWEWEWRLRREKRGIITKTRSFLGIRICSLSRLRCWFHECIHMSKCIQLFTLDMCSLLHVKYTLYWNWTDLGRIQLLHSCDKFLALSLQCPVFKMKIILPTNRVEYLCSVKYLHQMTSKVVRFFMVSTYTSQFLILQIKKLKSRVGE